MVGWVLSSLFPGPFILLEWGFSSFSLFEYAAAGDDVGEIRVENGLSERLRPILTEDAAMVTEKIATKEIEAVIDLPEKIKAPVYQGQKVGVLNFVKDGKIVKTFDLVAPREVGEKTLIGMLFQQLANLFRLFSGWNLL